MTKPIVTISSEDLLSQAQTPMLRLLSALSEDKPGQILNPDRIQRALDWTRSYKPDDPQYTEKLAIETDYRHLGFFDEHGELIEELAALGRDFIIAHGRETPNYSRLWRHVQAHLGKVQPEDLEADYAQYCDRVALLVDQEAGNAEIGEAVLRADQDGLDVPTTSLCQADRLRLILGTFPATRREEMIKTINARDLDWFPPDNAANAIRQLLKDQRYGLAEDEVNAWIDDNGRPSLSRQIKAAFGHRSKARNLRDLGLLDEKWQWSELGFQQHRAILKEAQAEGRAPSFEWLRWETRQRHYAGDSIPFTWALMNDMLPNAAVHRARRVASIALSGGLLGQRVEVEETLSETHYDTLRKIGTWITDPLEYRRHDALWWLGLLARNDDINWQNVEQICSFLYDKLDQTPDRSLITDWMEGLVTFEGRGLHHRSSIRAFTGGAKVGRNEKCPCNSGKKYKKCCGR